ncbi:UDP-glucosyltransferase 2-like [Pectinophora gossypiella]|uniref:UDP-glucosyltransferase 2-like n=1 Tax=Pectinophora gossypiella TaxID=13191 RepID=UPI00214F4F49|nr:UDP-glucosyltransferase 2-like [Pectinophora gossypiella]
MRADVIVVNMLRGIDILLMIFVVYDAGSAYKILVVFPIPGMSHAILGEGYVKPLLEAGHEVTYITPIPTKNATGNLREIIVSSNFNIMQTEQVLNIEKILYKKIDLHDLSGIMYLAIMLANNTGLDGNVQRLLHDPKEKFDVVIVEWFLSEVLCGFASVFNCPLIWASSMEPHWMALSIIDDYLNPTYTADIFSSNIPPYTFAQRIVALWSHLKNAYKKWSVSGVESEIYQNIFSSAGAERGRTLPPFSEAKYNGSLMFGNSHVSSGQSLRLPQNYKPIAGYHIDPEIKPLQKDLKEVMDVATHGVIYFSMGSLLKSTQIPDTIIRGIVDVFAGLKQTVIWKYEEKLHNIPKNLQVLQWAPQQTILAHPNCVLFITHGGLLSTTEAIHFGVPIIGVPMFGDQFINVDRAVNKGFAKRVDLDFETPVNLKTAIEDILQNPRYKEKVKTLSFVHHHRPIHPKAEILHWVEHVVRTRGAPHLRSPALHVPWYQKVYLDLAALMMALLLLIYFVAITLYTSLRQEHVCQHKKLN